LRAFDPSQSNEDAVRLLCVSFDSTLKANLSVGMPLDVHIYEGDSFREGPQFRIEEDDEAFNKISNGWGDSLKTALDDLPKYDLPK